MLRKTLLIIVLLSTIQKVFCKENQYFKVKPTDQEGKEGDSVEFQCHIGNRGGDVQWSKDGFLLGFDPKIPGYPRYSMDVKEEDGIYNLHIKNVNFQDEGEFQCQVGPALNHTPIRAAAQLRILIPPEYISVNGLGQASTVEVRENASVRLTCQAVGSKPPARLKWYRDGVEVPKESVHNEERKDKTRFIATSYLTIRPAVDDDGSKYACEAFHKALTHRMRTEVTLSVLHPPGQPRIEGYEEGTTIKAGEVLTLMCITEGGNPPPQLIWYRENAQIDATFYPLNGDSSTANNLTFTVSATDNTGAYYCKAFSSAIKDPLVASIKLNVYYLSNKMWIRGPTEAPRGETVTLSCETDISNPRSSLTWTMDGTTLKAGEELHRATPDGWITISNLTITLTRQEPDTKTFSCHANNPHVSGTASTTHTLRVIYSPKAPTIQGYTSGTPLRVGDIQRFNCVSVGGNPPPMLRWFKGDREISTPVVTSGSGVSSELVIRVQLNDNGALYRCEANNSALKKPLSAFVKVNVRFPPSNVSISVYPSDPRDGDNVTVTCTSSSSNPLSRISWKRDDVTVREHREETISSVYGGIASRSRISFIAKAADHQSQFTCLSRNDEFKNPVSSALELRIRHLPIFLDPQKSFDVREKNSLAINMTAVAFPEKIIYVWSKDGKPIDSSDGSSRIFAAGPVLQLRNATREDAGVFQCIAENDEGQSKVVVEINVLYGANVQSVIISSPSGPVFEGSEATLECKVTAHPATKDMIKWRIKGGLARAARNSPDNTKSILHVANVSRDMRGSVECWADNGIGSPSVMSILLNVLYKPLIIYSGGEMDKDGGHMKCVVDGTPNVTVTWTFNGTALRMLNEKYTVTPASQGEMQWSSTLIIRDIDANDYGIYTCSARNLLGRDSVDIILNDKGIVPDQTKTSAAPKDSTVKSGITKWWWIVAVAGGVVFIVLCCFTFVCCIRKRSNRTTPERSQQTRHIDINSLSAEDVCNKLLLSADVKSILLCSEKPHLPLHELKGHSVFTIEDTYKIDKLRTRSVSKDEKDFDSKSVESGLKDAFSEEIHHIVDKTKGDCPDILRNEKCLCLTTSKESGEPCTSPQSDSPESPRFNSTPSGSTGSCLSVYHEKTSIRSLGDIDSAAVMKLHPIMVLRIEEDAYKFSET